MFRIQTHMKLKLFFYPILMHLESLRSELTPALTAVHQTNVYNQVQTRHSNNKWNFPMEPYILLQQQPDPTQLRSFKSYWISNNSNISICFRPFNFLAISTQFAKILTFISLLLPDFSTILYGTFWCTEHRNTNNAWNIFSIRIIDFFNYVAIYFFFVPLK